MSLIIVKIRFPIADCNFSVGHHLLGVSGFSGPVLKDRQKKLFGMDGILKMKFYLSARR
jgi:hypothetical protein